MLLHYSSCSSSSSRVSANVHRCTKPWVSGTYCEQKMMDGGLLQSYDGDDDNSVDGNYVSRSVTMARAL